MEKRVTVCEWLCDTIEANLDFFEHRGTAAPEDVIQRTLHSTKCTAWVAISKNGILGPYWFEDENERPRTVNTERYVENKF